MVILINDESVFNHCPTLFRVYPRPSTACRPENFARGILQWITRRPEASYLYAALGYETRARAFDSPCRVFVQADTRLFNLPSVGSEARTTRRDRVRAAVGTCLISLRISPQANTLVGCLAVPRYYRYLVTEKNARSYSWVRGVRGERGGRGVARRR